MPGSAPFRIVTDRLSLRAFGRADAPSVKEAIDSSLDHLRGFMAVASDAPSPLEVVEAQLAGLAGLFERGRDFSDGTSRPARRSSGAAAGSTRG